MNEAEIRRRPALSEDVRADVCIVGSGIAGLTAAYLLSKSGLSTVVLESKTIAGGESSRTTAHIVTVHDDGWRHMEALHGVRGNRLCAESYRSAVAFMENTVSALRVDCGFERVNGYLFTPPEQSPSELDEELQAARRAGLSDVDWLDRAPLPDFNTGPALRFGGQAQFHPRRYYSALADAIEQQGGALYENSHAVEMRGGEDAAVTTADGRRVFCRDIIIATNVPVNDVVTMHTKLFPYRTYVVAGTVPKDSLEHGLYWDTAEPYHYARVFRPLEDPAAGSPAVDLLVVGGEDHKTGQQHDMQQRLGRLEDWTRERFPQVEQFHWRWSGQVAETVDGMPYIGRNPGDAQNVYIATGDSGTGMTHGTLAGMIISDLIRDEQNPWADFYSPSRSALRSISHYLRENLNVAAQYSEWVSNNRLSSSEEIPFGCGAVLRRGLSKMAVFRDGFGTEHRFSARCPHLGGVVSWNDMEKTWDCPCHGSRFDRFGNVIHGPATTGLRPWDETAVANQPIVVKEDGRPTSKRTAEPRDKASGRAEQR